MSQGSCCEVPPRVCSPESGKLCGQRPIFENARPATEKAQPGISTKNTEKIPSPKFWTPRIYHQNTPKIPKKYPQSTRIAHFGDLVGIFFVVFYWGSRISARGVFFRYFFVEIPGRAVGILRTGLCLEKIMHPAILHLWNPSEVAVALCHHHRCYCSLVCDHSRTTCPQTIALHK